MTDLHRWALRAERVALILIAIMSGLVIIHLLAMQVVFNESLELADRLEIEYWHLSIFDLDEEESFGTWFSAVILLIAAILSARFAGLLQNEGDPWHRGWKILGYGFCYLSIDEVVALHELLNSLTEDTPWTLFGLIVVAIVGICYLPFLWHYRWRTGGLLAFAGVCYAGGALGVEHFSGTDLESLRYNMLTALEEGLEMSGVILAIYTILDLIRTHSDDGPLTSRKC